MSDTDINPAFTVVDDDDGADEHTTPPLWKQLLGAVVGATIALILYGAYQLAQPVVMALLVPEHGQAQKKQPEHVAPVSAAHREKRATTAQ